MRRWLLLLLAVGCSSPADTSPFVTNGSSSGGTKVCAAGHQVNCGCPGGQQSVQVCLADGSGYAGCQCGSSSSGGMGGMSSSSSGGMGGAPPVACMKQQDCAAFADACHVGNCFNGACEKAPAPDGLVCDDGLFCTEGDHCQAGACVGSGAKACPPGSDACHVAFCDGQKQACALAPGNDGAACDDKNPCTGDGSCNGGLCLAGTPISCAQFDTACTQGVCDPQLGCGSKPANEGLQCNDGLFCTDGDVCLAGTCAGKAKVCPPPADVCMSPACDEVNKTCGGAPGNNGTFCNDLNICTTGEKCSSGTCGGGAPVNGISCNDQNACTANDTCGGGACAGTPIVACVDGDGCCPAGCPADMDCAPLSQPSYIAAKTFQDALGGSLPTGLTWDGSNYWEAGGHYPSDVNLARYDAMGSFLASYKPGYNLISIFVKQGGSVVYGQNDDGTGTILAQTSPGVMGPATTLSKLPDSASGVLYDDTTSEYVGQMQGIVSRWSDAGQWIQDTQLIKYGTLPNDESNSPAFGRMAVGGKYWLTYSGGMLSAWDHGGNRVGTTQLVGAGQSGVSDYSFSYANKMVWIVDDVNGTWRGYNVGL